MTLVRPDANRAWRELATALDQVRDTTGTPCTRNPTPYTTERYRDREDAAAACTWCPVLVQCSRFAIANHETENVWGGVNLTSVQPAGARQPLLEAAARRTGGQATPPPPPTGELGVNVTTRGLHGAAESKAERTTPWDIATDDPPAPSSPTHPTTPQHDREDHHR